MSKTIKKKNKNKSVNMTINEANAHNAMTPNNAFMIGIGTEDNPEFIYPEELEPSVATASLTESRNSRAAKESSTFRDRSLVGHIGAGMDQNLGDKSLQNIAALSIGVPLIATNPATAPILENATKDILHTGKVLLDPTKAVTGIGQAAATIADIYGTIEGLRQVPNAAKNIIQRTGTTMDYFNLATGLMGPFGTFNAIKGARFNPYLRQVAGYKNLGLEDGDRLNHIEQITNNVRTPMDDPSVQRFSETQRIRTQQMLNQAQQAEDDLPYWATQGSDAAIDDINIDFDDEGRMIVTGRHGRINESGSSVTNDINELRQQDDEINAIISRNTPRFRPLFPEVYERNAIREIRDKNLLGRYIELKTGKTLSDIADNYVLVDLQPVPISEIKTIMRNKGFNEEFINFSLQNFAESVRSAIGNPINANNIRGFNYHKFEPDFRTGTQAFKLNKVRTNPETGIKHIFENYFGLHTFGNKVFNDTNRIKSEDKEILDELISLYNNRTSSNLSFNDLNDVDKFADFRNFLRTLWHDKKFPGDINGMAMSDAEGFGEFKPFSTSSNYDAMKVLKKSEDILNRLPRGYSMAEDNTSYDSEMLKLLKVIKNKDKYGRKAGQYSVESLGTSSWGNDFHKEQIRIGDILNEYRDKLSQSDIDYIESIINRNPNGKPSPELINIIKEKYDSLGDKLAKSLYKTWGRILDIDPSLNIDREIITYEPFNERSVFSDIIRKGKATPRIYRPDIRIHHNKLGGKHKCKFGGMKQDKVFKLKGGVAIPLDDKKRLFYLSGAKHEQGGIDVTPELEAEGGEVVKINPKSIKVVTAQKIMGGKSPAELVVDASSTGKSEKVFNKVFDYQENFKDRHNLNDDGTKKAELGKEQSIETETKGTYVDKLIANYITNNVNKLGKEEFIKRLHNNLIPFGYGKGIIGSVRRIYNAVNKNKQEEEVKGQLPGKWNRKMLEDSGVMDIYGEYLGIPKEDRYFSNSYVENSKYKPTTSTDENVVYKTLSPLPEKLRNNIINEGMKLKLGDIKESPIQDEAFNTYTISRGEDDKGEYISFYDKWDLNPTRGTEGSKLLRMFSSGDDQFVNLGIAKPLEFYDRIYLNDINKKQLGGEMKNKKKANSGTQKKFLNGGDWVNIGANALGATTNLLTGLLSPDTKYARMKDPIPVIAPKINSNVNTIAEENAIDQAYHDEIRSINENTADSKVALNRIRNAGAKRAASKVKIRSNAENIARDLINKGNILKGEYDKFNIQRQGQIDAYNAQAEAAEFNANKDKVGDAISGFVGDLMQGASTITNTLEKREADRNNAILTTLGYPEINHQTLDQTRKNLYKQMYLQDDIDRLKNRKTKIQSKKWSNKRKDRVTKRIDNRINKLENF